jgi:membrane protease YdiL (CAAX protease family)
LLIFALTLLLLWSPIAIPAHLFISDANLVNLLTLPVLYLEFLWLVRFWGRRVHRQPFILWDYGLEFSPRSFKEVLAGLGLGLFSFSLLVGLEMALGWLSWQAPSSTFFRIGLEGLVISLAFGFAEELLFRGWLLDELQRDYTPKAVLWINAILFAAIHFRLMTFPALVILGVALVWAKRSQSDFKLGKRCDRLSLPIGLHAGLIWGNYLLEVGKLIQYTNRVPAWVTGIDRNPLAGLMGILLLSLLAIGLWRFANRPPTTGRW